MSGSVDFCHFRHIILFKPSLHFLRTLWPSSLSGKEFRFGVAPKQNPLQGIPDSQTDFLPEGFSRPPLKVY